MLAASFLTGAIVLVVEILGTRVLSPYYGASVYVWSALIGVTLGSLTLGYLAGGWAADRRMAIRPPHARRALRPRPHVRHPDPSERAHPAHESLHRRLATRAHHSRR